MPWLFILFVVVPAFELYLLIQIGQVIGALETFGIILGTGLVGSWMAKTQGLSVWKNLNHRLTTGQIPGKELLDGVIILVSGAFLLTPGVLTDVVGLLGLLPVTRAIVRKSLLAFLSGRISLEMSDTLRRSQSFEPDSPLDPETKWSGTASQSPGYMDTQRTNGS